MIGIFVRVFGTRKEIFHLDQAPDDMQRFSLLEVGKDIFQTCQNRNYLKTGHAKTAIFYSARGLFSQTSRSLGILIGGFVMMHLVKMPVGAVPGKVGMDVISRLGLVFVLRLIETFISIFFYARYRLSRAEHSEIRAET